MKKFIALLLAAILVVGGVGGGIYWKSQKSGKPVNVYAASDLSTTYWGDENQTYGMVNTDHTQSVYLSNTQSVEQIMVEVGQNVKKGDVLMTYDTTLSQVELEKKSLEIQKMEIELKKAQDKLAKIKTYRPGRKIPEKNLVDNQTDSSGMAVLTAAPGMPLGGMALMSGSWLPFGKMVLTADGTPEGEEPPKSGEITEPGESGSDSGGSGQNPGQDSGESGKDPSKESESAKPTEPKPTDPKPTEPKPTEPKPTETQPTEPASSEDPGDDPEEPVIPEKVPEFIGGEGSEKTAPFVYNWNDDYVIDQGMLKYLSQGRSKAWVILRLNLNDKDKTQITQDPFGSWWKMLITNDHGVYSFNMKEMCVNGSRVEMEFQNPSEDPEDPFGPDYPWYGGGGYDVTYTAAEIAEMLAEATEEVRDMDLELRMAKVEYGKMEQELNGGAVVAELDGVITTVRGESEAKLEGTPLIDVSGGGGYYVKGSFSELKMDQITVGMEVTVMSWESYQSYVGVVKEIGEYPVSENYLQGDGNSNASTYSFTVFIDESANLREYEYVSLTYAGAVSTKNSFYLDNSMIRSENGKSYVYVKGSDDLLEKRTIRIGRGLWGSYTEILSGLKQSDEIAFPYGPDVKEGAPTVSASTDQLYVAN